MQIMTKLIFSFLLLSIALFVGCSNSPEETNNHNIGVTLSEESPKQMLRQAYQLFKEGKDSQSIAIANRVLEIGRSTKNDTLIGRALTSLCRNSQRTLDTIRLAELSENLSILAASSGNKQWLMYRAHQNAEMWRLVGNLERAESFYNESMKISYETGAMGMYTIDHFNKSFVSIAKGDLDTARALIKKYYALRQEADLASQDAYGLIALAYLLEQQEDYEGAHGVAVVTRRLFEEQNVFPEPPDEKPLIRVEAKVVEELDTDQIAEISNNAKSLKVSDLLSKYL